MDVNILFISIDDSLYKSLVPIFLQEDIKIINANTLKEAKDALYKNNVFLLISSCKFDKVDDLILESKALDIFRPIIVLDSSHECKMELLYMGINVFYESPICLDELVTQSLSLITLYHAKKDSKSQNDVFRTLSIALEVRDPYTHGHGERVSIYATTLYDAMGLKDYEDRESLRSGCIIHDVGKIGTPDDILKSNKNLDPNEFLIIKNHPIEGVKICNNIVSNEKIIDIIEHHHEKLDGSGYPYGLKGREISDLVQITTICDIYDALTSDRSYRIKNTQEEALQIMLDEFVMTDRINKGCWLVFKHLLNIGTFENIKYI